MFRFSSLLVAFGLLANAQAAEPVRQPNVIVILADDQGWGDLSLHGNTNLRTPKLDAFAKSGARFERFFVQPVCSPTRAEFLTGRWHPRCGVHGVTTGAERLNLDEHTIADAFKAAGYATGCFGKWHNGSQYPYHPNGRGFQEYYGFTSGHWGEYFDPPLDHNGAPVKGAGYITDDLTNRAIAFLNENASAGRPSFCFLALNTPHSPMQVPEKYWLRFGNAPLKMTGGKKENTDHTRAALAMCENIDDNVGRLLAAISDRKLEENTIVVFFSDNGPNGARWNGGMKGIKGSTDEGGVRSPLFISWPGKIPAGTIVSPIAAAIDLYPTLSGLTGVKRQGDRPFDGTSLASRLLGKDSPAPDRILFQQWAGKVSARDQRFRLDPTGQLFDMVNDPDQMKNVAADHPQAANRMVEAVARWKRDVLGELPKTESRPFPVGFAAFPRTELPARDGIPHGSVKRSASAPNCSFFTNWKKTEDRMTWDVEVNAAGRYEAIIHYTCAKADIGSTVELVLGDAKWTGTVALEHDPPLQGMERDRVFRGGESYVKDFRPLSLGIVELKAGRGTLVLSASKIARAQIADVRAVELVLIVDKK